MVVPSLPQERSFKQMHRLLASYGTVLVHCTDICNQADSRAQAIRVPLPSGTCELLRVFNLLKSFQNHPKGQWADVGCTDRAAGIIGFPTPGPLALLGVQCSQRCVLRRINKEEGTPALSELPSYHPLMDNLPK